jgi:V8-like Glu-specific endopeptidase
LNRLILAITFFVLSFQASAFSDSVRKVIYGVDNRVEADQFPDAEIREHALSVAGMVPKNRLVVDPNNPEVYNYPKIQARHAIGLCEDEPYARQVVLPVCTGFLVAPDVLLTAGHCFETAKDCEDFSWAFGYTHDIDRLPINDVYGCAEILEKKLSSSFGKIEDYAVIRLDRAVTDREPLQVRTRGRARLGTDVVVVGHPMGLPLKASDGAQIARMNAQELKRLFSSLFRRRYYFSANLDTYAGNSGSPVFDSQSGVVEGLLIEGAEDFEIDEENRCLRSAVRSNKRWDVEERVMRTTKIPYLKTL